MKRYIKEMNFKRVFLSEQIPCQSRRTFLRKKPIYVRFFRKLFGRFLVFDEQQVSVSLLMELFLKMKHQNQDCV